MGNTGVRNTRIIQRGTGNGGKGIPGNWCTGIHMRITAGHCGCRFQAARRGWGWIMDLVQVALMKRCGNITPSQDHTPSLACKVVMEAVGRPAKVSISR